MLRTLVARAYGAEQVPDGDDFAHEITEGWFNVAYRIVLRDGRQVVLKIAPPADVTVLTREIGMMRAELEAMRLVSTRTSVPVPRVDHADLSHDVVDADLFFMEYVDADNFGLAAAAGRLTPEVIAAGNRELGTLNREINTVVGPHFGPLIGEGFATWREAFTAALESTLVDGERVGIHLGWEPDQVREVLAENAETLDEVTAPQLIEVDLWTKNSMIRDGRIVAILDHERALYGDPLMEAGLTLDPLLIFGLDLGVVGAGLGTVGGQAVSAAMSVWFFFVQRRRPYRVGLRQLLPHRPTVLSVLAVAGAAYAVCARVQTFVSMPQTGITQGAQPIISFNAGRRQFARVRRTRTLALSATVVYGAAAAGVVALAAHPIAAAFQALGSHASSYLISVGTLLLLKVPLVLLLGALGPVGIWIALPAGEALAATAAIAVLWWRTAVEAGRRR